MKAGIPAVRSTSMRFSLNLSNMYGRVEPGIAFRHNDHLFLFIPGGYGLFIQGIVDFPDFGPVFAHREREELDYRFLDFQFFDNTGRTGE